MKKKDLAVVNRVTREPGFGKKEYYQHYFNFTFEGETYKGFTNGYMILASVGEDFGYTLTMDFAKGVQAYMSKIEYINEKTDLVEIQLDKADIEARKRINRENHSKSAYDLQLGYGLNPDYNPELHIGFNPKYMLDCMSFFNTDRCFIEKDGFNRCGVYTHPIYFRNDKEKKIGVVMPVNITDKYNDKKVKNNIAA